MFECDVILKVEVIAFNKRGRERERESDRRCHTIQTGPGTDDLNDDFSSMCLCGSDQKTLNGTHLRVCDVNFVCKPKRHGSTPLFV